MLLCWILGAITARAHYIVLFKDRPAAGSMSIKEAVDNNITRTQALFTSDDRITRRVMNGYMATLSDSTVERLQKDPGVEVVERDEKVKIAEIEIAGDSVEEYETGSISKLAESFILQKNAPWGLSRISGHESDYEYIEDAGKGVNVYVLDTGVDVNHKEFEGRATWGFNALENDADEDTHGHGTHCAGIIAGRVYGIAKKANIIAVKVLNGRGEGMISSLIEGIDFVMKDHEEKTARFYDSRDKSTLSRFTSSIGTVLGDFFEGSSQSSHRLVEDVKNIFRTQQTKPKAIVNMSVGGTKSVALNLSIKYATKYLNIHFSTAAGNEHKDACSYSPASSGSSFTIGASDKSNIIASFSNVGRCVDIFAPGDQILSAWPNNSTKIASGTSMAAPHVSGIMAIYAGLADFKPEELKARIIKDAEMTVKDLPASNPSLFSLRLFRSKDEDKPMASVKKLYKRIKSD